jgi:hypothetical protein
MHPQSLAQSGIYLQIWANGELMDQRIAIDEKIEALFSDGASLKDSTKKWHKRKMKSEAPAEPTPQGKRRQRVTPHFTDAEMEKMIRESDEGKTAREIMQEYGFKSTNDWYMLKSNYKKKKRLEQSSDPDDMPDHDDADDEEPEDEPVAQRPTETARVAKRYDYQCNCGYSFKSTIPPQLIKCPDCMGKPKVVEEVEKE